LSDPNGKPTNPTKLWVWLQAAIHGNEPAADQGAMALLRKMDANATWTASLREKMDIFVMPRYNSDGVHYFQRYERVKPFSYFKTDMDNSEFVSNIDPNREHTKLVTQHSRDVKQLFSFFDSHISIVMHEFAGHNEHSGRYRHGLDAMIGGGNNLNIHPMIRNLSENTFVANMGRLLESRCIRWGPYVLGDTSDVEGSPILFEELSTMLVSGTNSNGMTQTVSIQTEVRGQWLADQHFQRRTAASRRR
jgi:hypothetical protein